MLNNKSLLLITLTLLIVSLTIFNITAEVQTLGKSYPQNSTVNLIQSCKNSTYSNITMVLFPDSNFALNGQYSMEDNEDSYNYTFTNTSLIGQYLVYGFCDENGIIQNWQYDFYISRRGTNLTLEESVIYVIFLIFIGLLFIGSSYFSFRIPFKNLKNSYGETVMLTKIKYFKLVFIAVSYGLFLWILNLLIGIADNFAYLTMFYGFFNFVFMALIRLSYLVFVVLLIVGFVEIVRDFQFKKKINELFGIR